MLETGVPNLDRILGGGVPAGDVLLIVGPAGSGKTTLALQMAFHCSAAGRKTLYASTLSETPNRVLKHTRGLAFYDESVIGRHLFLLDVYPVVKRGLAAVRDALVRAVGEHGAELLVLDGLTALHDLYPGSAALRTFLYELGAALAALECTGVLTSSRTDAGDGDGAVEFTMADGIVKLDRRHVGARTLRSIRAEKMRGRAPVSGDHALRIDGGGVTAFPRIESLYAPGTVGLRTERTPSGLAELDGMMNGGLPAGSATVLAGALGTGKTLTCLHFVMEGVRRGEKVMLAAFRETPEQLMDKARVFGMDLESAVREGRAAIFHRPAIEMVVDELTFELWSELDLFGPQRLALDSVVELEYAILEPGRQRGYLTALVELLRTRGVTSVFTVETPQVVGPELDFSGTTMAVLAENLVLLRNVQFRAALVSIISILKMRDSAFDSSIRQYRVTDRGIDVVPPSETTEGLLAAIARLPIEARAASGTGAGWRT